MTSVDDNDTVQIVPDPDKLFVYHRQQLSAMLDGELSPDEAKFMLRRLQHDVELAACWERWQVCGDVLRGQRNDLLPADFARRVAVAVGAGGHAAADVHEARVARRPRLARWGGGAAVAASVALMAVFVGRQLPEAALEPVAEPVPMVAQAGSAPAQAQDPVAAEAAPGVPVATIAAADVPAPETPVAQPDAAVALAAVAAAAEAPRRAAQRRATRTQPRAAAAQTAQAPVAIAAANDALPPASFADGAMTASDAFAMPQATARPWPRALLSPQSGFTVSSGGLLPREPRFEPRLPGGHLAPWGAPLAAPAEPQADAAVQP